jgi:hypothetical protein
MWGARVVSGLREGLRAELAKADTCKVGLMKYRVTKQDNSSGLSVQIDGVSGQEPAVLEQIRRCRQSAWACPSGECLNIGSIDERVEDGRIFLTLTPRPGAQLEPSGIEECLGYMLRQVVRV